MTPSSNYGKSFAPTAGGTNVPDLTEPVLAYRHWKLDTASGHLIAPYQNFVWHNGENVAYCEAKQMDACGDRYCGCGFYAVYSDSHEYAETTSLTRHRVFGVIAAYGKVSLGQFGLRSQKAKIVALHVPFAPRWTPSRSIVNLLLRTYPDARFYKERSNLILAEGVHEPKELWRSRNSRAFG